MKVIKSVIIFIVYCILIIVFEGITGWVRKYIFEYDTLVMYLKYFILTLIVLKFNPKYFHYLCLSFIVVMLTIIIGLEYPWHDLIEYGSIREIFHSLPNVLFGLLGMTSGYILIKKNTKISVFIITSSIIGSLLFIKNFDNYYYFINYYNIYKNDIIHNYNLLDENNNTVKFNQEKYIVLDFWHLQCIPCIIEFPKFEELKNKYSNNNNIEFYSINYPINNTSKKDVLDKTSNFSFKTLFGKESIKKEFKITVFPTIIILKNNQPLFRGSLKDAENYLINKIEKK